MLNRRQELQKRIFDVSISLIALLVLIIPLILLLVFSRVSTGSSGLFRQKRIGQFGKPFIFYKIRTLKGENHDSFEAIQQNGTPFGRWLRKTKLDELPQLFNVIKGDMSLVGPRPDLPGYADRLQGKDRELLLLRPGITGPATVKYKEEHLLLKNQQDPQAYNDLVIWPDKVRINRTYMKNWSLWKDIQWIYKTVVHTYGKKH